MSARRKVKLAIWKFASCGACRLTLLDAIGQVSAGETGLEIASCDEPAPAEVRGPYEISLVEGSITTPRDAERIRAIRRASEFLATIGGCAAAGGFHGLRYFDDVDHFRSGDAVRRDPPGNSTPIGDHVFVDFELRGCPVSAAQLIELITAWQFGRPPNTPPHSVCGECKRLGFVCVMIARGMPCMGPVTQEGCSALCPAAGRGCYGCFGPKETPNPAALSARWRQLEANEK